METVTKSGRIISFSTLSMRGRVAVELERYEFLSTSFLALRRPRFPRPGETVEVTLAGCFVLTVCGE